MIHLDLMFNKTESSVAEDGAASGESDQPMAVHLVAVDEQTNYTICCAVESKASEHLRTAVTEVVKMATMLGHMAVTLRGDTEPAMKSCLQMISDARTRLGCSTKIEHAVPQGSLHQGLKAERSIGIVRNMGKCLLHHVQEKTGFVVKSSHPLYQWAFVHAAFLYTRFHVLQSGQTPFELALGREYTGKLCAFGSPVYAQVVPYKKSKGEPWQKFVFLGKTAMGNLSVVGNKFGVFQARTMRKGSMEYDTEMIVDLRGVPWDTQLNVVTSRKRARSLPRVINPALLAAQAPGDHLGDEAASDPESEPGLPNPALAHPGGVAGTPPGSGGQSSMASPMSAVSEPELIPDAAMLPAGDQNVAQIQGHEHECNEGGSENYMRCFVREIREDMPHGHEPEQIPEVEMDLYEWETDYVKEDVPIRGGSDGPTDVPWSHRSYEDGPPTLGPEEMLELDEAMDRVEISRLLGMGVLKRIPVDGNVDGMKKLNSKIVRDWRFRGNVWVRRSRLVAKEFRFLEPHLNDLYAPASMAVLQRVLAGLCASGRNLVLYSIDVSDAYLQVPQVRPTFIVTDDGEAMQLLYSLPGQRSAARQWYLFLKDVVEADNMQAFKGAPAVFYEKGQIACSSHVDDLQTLGFPERSVRFQKAMKAKGLKIKIEGPVTMEGGECRFLKRLFVGDGTGIRVVPEQKYVEKLIDLLQLHKSASKPTPLPGNLKPPAVNAELTGEDYTTYRSGLGLLLYMCSDYPEIHFAVRMLGSKCSSPTEFDLMIMRHVGKYMKGRESMVLKLWDTSPGMTFEQRLRFGMAGGCDEGIEKERGFGVDHVLEVVTDADWASSHFSRKSVSSYVLFLNGNAIYVSTKLQQSLALSSCESEYMASLAGCCDALFVKSLLEDLTGSAVRLIHRTDNSGEGGSFRRRGQVDYVI